MSGDRDASGKTTGDTTGNKSSGNRGTNFSRDRDNSDGSDRNGRSGGNVDRNNAGGGNNLPCWFNLNCICNFGQRYGGVHEPICETWRDYGECRINNCNLLHQNLCRKFFSLEFCDRYNCLYTHTRKRWCRDSVSPSNGSTQRNNWNNWKSQGYQNNY